MKPIWKKLLAAGCAVAVLFTSQGVPVAAAADMYETQAEVPYANEEHIDAEIPGEVPTDGKIWGSDVNTETDAVIPDVNIQPDAAESGGNAQPGTAEVDEATQPGAAGTEAANGADSVDPDGLAFAEDDEEALVGRL